MEAGISGIASGILEVTNEDVFNTKLEAERRNKAWKSKCKKKNWNFPASLTNLQQSFDEGLYVKEEPEDRETPVAEWHEYYNQRVHLHNNWCNGKFKRNVLKGERQRMPANLTYATEDPATRNFLPVVEMIDRDRKGNPLHKRKYLFLILKLDQPGFTVRVGCFDSPIESVCVDEDLIVYIEGILVKRIRIHKAPSFVQFTLLDKAHQLPTHLDPETPLQRDLFLLCVNKKYIAAGHQWDDIAVWSRTTGDHLLTFRGQGIATVMGNLTLNGNLLHCKTWQGVPFGNYAYFTYDLQKQEYLNCNKSSGHVQTMLSKYNYQIAVVSDHVTAHLQNIVCWENDKTEALWSAVHDSRGEAKWDAHHIYFHKNYIVYCEGPQTFVMVYVKTGRIYKRIFLPMEDPITSLHFVCSNLVIVKTYRTIYIWKYTTSELLYTLENACNDRAIFVDETRIVAQSDNGIILLTFW